MLSYYPRLLVLLLLYHSGCLINCCTWAAPARGDLALANNNNNNNNNNNDNNNDNNSNNR